MAWIESNQELGRHPKTKNLAKSLDISMAAAVGYVHYLWWWALDFAQEGLLNKFNECDIAEACTWEGDSKKFVNTLVLVGFLDRTESNLCIHDWYDYAGRLIERRHAEAERKQRNRAKQKKTSNKQAVYRGRPADIPRTSAVCTADVLRHSTVPNTTVPNSTVPLDTTIIITTRDEENLINENDAGEDENETLESVNEQAEDANDSSKNVIALTQVLNGLREKMNMPENIKPMAVGTESINWAEKNWGRMLSPGESRDIISWCDEFVTRGCQEPDAVISEALKQCDYAGVRNIKYLKAILTDWREAGVLTVAQVEAREAERSKSQKDHKRNKDPGDKPSKTPTTKYDNFYL